MKRTITSLSFLLLFLCMTFAAHALNYPKTTQNGKEFYVYTVKEHEGLYHISTTFGISQEEIIKYNPAASKGAQKGMTLKIPTSPAPKKVIKENPGDKAVNLQTITVDKGQTIYSISKKYHTTAETLNLYNPELKNGIKVGQTIKVPAKSRTTADTKPASKQKIATTTVSSETTNSTIEHTVKAKETLYGISRVYGVSTADIIKANLEAKDGVKEGQVLRIPSNEAAKKTAKPTEQEKKIKPAVTAKAAVPVVIPTPAPAIEEAPAIVPTANANKTLHNVRVALLLPLMLNNKEKRDATIDKFVEFYEGMLLGIKKLKDQGISVELNTYDTEKSADEVNAVLIKNPEIKNANFIIGPAYSTQIKPVSEFAKENHIPLVIPFSQNVPDLTSNPYVFEFNCPDKLKMSTATQLFINNFKNKNIIILRFNDDLKDEGSLFGRNLESQLKRQNIKFYELAFTPAVFSTLDKYLTKGKESIIVFATEEKELVQDFLPKIKTLNTATTPVSVFGFYNWQNQLKAYPSTYYYTPFFEDLTNKEYVNYNERFRSEFGNPTSSYPRFDILGYDLSTYFISRIATSKPLNGDGLVNGMQSKLDFQKFTGGGYVNKGLFLIQYEGSAGERIVE